MRPTRAFAALALAASVSAQGSLGGSQGSCTTAQAWAYRGCYGDVANGANAGFTFKLVGSASPSDPNYYPGYTTGKVSVDICLQGCRGHGFRFAALHGATDCYCGTKKPTTQTLGSSTTSNATINECHVTSLGGCQGNTNQYCGSLAASDVYEDTSFPNVALAAQGGNYAYVGCITVISPGDFFYATTAANTAACQSACANLGYPFAGMSDKGGVTNACQCGTEIQKGSPASAGQSCLPCGGGDTGASCGGLVSGAPLITVYRNVNLQGCYSPQVPSSSATITSSSVMSTAPAATSSTPIVARDTTPRIDGRCGSAFGGATCDPAGVYGGCCSSGGYCGTTTAHCLVSNGCQSGCTASAATAPRADGRCGTAFGGATCDPAGAYGGCCSSGGYCGTTPAHCLTSNGCQLGCVNPATTTTTTITSTSSSSIISTSASSALGGTAPRTDGRCGLSFGGATCDPNGAYGG
ncbi:MAG: hypothetical protein M1812_000197 [Candelaria pacifica]|nr:MAG: hypothetical protein M1812_000197 [Candelaria pacifica]